MLVLDFVNPSQISLPEELKLGECRERRIPSNLKPTAREQRMVSRDAKASLSIMQIKHVSTQKLY